MLEPNIDGGALLSDDELEDVSPGFADVLAISALDDPESSPESEDTASFELSDKSEFIDMDVDNPDMPMRRCEILEKIDFFEALIRQQQEKIEIAIADLLKVRTRILEGIERNGQLCYQNVRMNLYVRATKRVPGMILSHVTEQIKYFKGILSTIERENVDMRANVGRLRPELAELMIELNLKTQKNAELRARLAEGTSTQDMAAIMRLNDELDEQDETIRRMDEEFQAQVAEKTQIIDRLTEMKSKRRWKREMSRSEDGQDEDEDVEEQDEEDMEDEYSQREFSSFPM